MILYFPHYLFQNTVTNNVFIFRKAKISPETSNKLNIFIQSDAVA